MQKKIPMRMCVGCRTMTPKRELVRIACSSEGEVTVDPTGKAPGRGAYVCRKKACLERAVKTRALERAFQRAIGPEVFEALRERVEKLEAEDALKASGEGGGADG